MANPVLSERTAREIDQRVATILGDLGMPAPPLDLDQVRQLLNLDRRYYSSTDHGLIEDVIHRLTIGTKQVLARPTRILDAIKNKSLRALWVPERKRILIDETLPEIKKRWGEAHEIIHSVVPHHQVLTLGDPDYTLSSNCHEQLEAEANFGAGRLLFLQDQFRAHLMAQPVRFQSVHDLAKLFGNSKTSTLWRTVETLDVPAVGLVSVHPWTRLDDGQSPVRYFIGSPQFLREFANTTQDMLFHGLAKVVHRRGGGPIGENEVIIADTTGEEHVFFFECFTNMHDTLTLGIYRKRHAVVVSPAS